MWPMLIRNVRGRNISRVDKCLTDNINSGQNPKLSRTSCLLSHLEEGLERPLQLACSTKYQCVRRRVLTTCYLAVAMLNGEIPPLWCGLET